MMDKRTLIDLREELVKEKMAAEKLSGQLEMMSSQLAGVGISLKNDGSLDGIDNIQRSKQEEIKVANEAEGDELSCELAKLRVAAVGREDREVAMTGQLSSLQEEVATVAKEKACLQVENRTLQSQSSSLLAQINSLQSDYNKLESELAKSSTSEKEVKQELNQLLADQTRLQRLHDQLQSDYDRLCAEREDLKFSERLLREEIKKFIDSENTVHQCQDCRIKVILIHL